jgi:hypothetical protein
VKSVQTVLLQTVTAGGGSGINRANCVLLNDFLMMLCAASYKNCNVVVDRVRTGPSQP